jgi:hypothetical protein
MKFIVEYRPGGVLEDYAPLLYSSDPEPDVDAVVTSKGWDRRPAFNPKDVWVDGAF